MWVYLSVLSLSVLATAFFGLIAAAAYSDAMFRGYGSMQFSDAMTSAIVAGSLAFLSAGIALFALSRLVKLKRGVKK